VVVGLRSARSVRIFISALRDDVDTPTRHRWLESVLSQ
jgi:hypothetical protein